MVLLLCIGNSVLSNTAMYVCILKKQLKFYFFTIVNDKFPLGVPILVKQSPALLKLIWVFNSL